jgi:hypothetical protein
VSSAIAASLPTVLDRTTQEKIVKTAQELWDARCEAGDLDDFMLRKERGHGLADWVEDRTVEKLEDEFKERATFELTADGKRRRRRSMGDVWIESGGMFNPVNIKSGVKEPELGSNGHPNLVSLTKLTNALLERWIDSYYLLLVRFTASEQATAAVTLVDLLHIMEDYVGFDAGPGQLMLNARKFDDPPPARYTAMPTEAALHHLKDVREDGNRRLIANRQKELTKMNRGIVAFDSETLIDQTGLPLEEKH